MFLCSGTGLIRCGEAQKQLGEAERKFVQSTNIHFLTPLRSFTDGEYKAIQVNTCLRITCTQTRTFIVIITAVIRLFYAVTQNNI